MLFLNLVITFKILCCIQEKTIVLDVNFIITYYLYLRKAYPFLIMKEFSLPLTSAHYSNKSSQITNHAYMGKQRHNSEKGKFEYLFIIIYLLFSIKKFLSCKTALFEL